MYIWLGALFALLVTLLIFLSNRVLKMAEQVKKLFITLAGAACLFVGVFFVLLPGPAVIFLPLGLALLSLEYPWAKVWLRKVQRWFRKSAVQTDKAVVWLKRKFSS